MQNTYFEISIDKTCSQGEFIITPVIGHSVTAPVKIHLCYPQNKKLMEAFDKMALHDNALIKLCNNI